MTGGRFQPRLPSMRVEDKPKRPELSTGNPFVTIGCVTGVPVKIYQVTALSN